MSNINIKHFYHNMRINNKEKTISPDHWPLRATCIVNNWLKNKTAAFHQKTVLFETGDHCDVKYKY